MAAIRIIAARTRKGLAGAVIAAFFAVAWPAWGQDELSFNALLDRLDRLERQLDVLQRRLDPGSPAAVGPGDPVSAMRHATRLDDFELLLRQLTDRIERAEYRLRQFDQQMSLSLSDLTLRVAALEGAAPLVGAEVTAGAEAAMAAPPDTGPTDAAAAALPDAAPVTLIPPAGAGTLATVPAAALESDAEAVQTPEAVYEGAYAMLGRADYAGAEQALQRFIDSYPDHELTGNAYYWLGETHYSRQDYRSAAIAFARSYKAFPNGNKAPDNLLKLGMSFTAMGEKDNACVTFNKLRDDHPEARRVILDRLARESQRAGCS